MCYEHLIDKYIAKELTLGRIEGPFNSPPLDNFCTSPIGLVPKKEPGAFRVIHNLSYPHDTSINSSISKEDSAVQYENFDYVTDLVIQCGRGSFVAKADVESAFRIIPIHPSSHHLLGFTWKDMFYFDKCLPMGCSVSCNLFERFSVAIQWILLNKYRVLHMSHILDDFIFIAHKEQECLANLNAFMDLATRINLPIKTSKTVKPTQVVVVHGIEVDTMNMVARLPRGQIG